jgi:hypothetical protein
MGWHLIYHAGVVRRIAENGVLPNGWHLGRRRRIASRFSLSQVRGTAILKGLNDHGAKLLSLEGWWGGYIAKDGARLCVIKLAGRSQASRWVRGLPVRRASA